MSFELEELGGWQGKAEMFSRFKPSSGRKEIIVLLTKKINSLIWSKNIYTNFPLSEVLFSVASVTYY